MASRRLTTFAVWIALGLAYFAAGKLGLMLAFVHASATAVWPPTGIAIAAFLLLGVRVWPGVFAGAFLVNLTTQGTVLTSLGIATGNTLEAVVATYLVTRFANGVRAFESAQDTFRFAALAGGVSTTIAATIGTATLLVTGFASPDQISSIWTTWWLGDAVGAVVVAPLLILWIREPQVRWRRNELAEAILLTLSVFIGATLVFASRGQFGVDVAPFPFLCVPLLLWAAFRFGPRETVSVIVLLSGIALWGTLRGSGPFASGSQQLSLLWLQTFIGTMVVMNIAVAAVVAERARAQVEARQLNELLEQRVVERTAQLESARKQSEVRLLHAEREQNARRQAEEANRLKDEFLAVVSHELRTPLNAILGWSHLLEAGVLDPEKSERALETIRRNAQMQARLIDDILDVSRMMTASISLNLGSTDIHTVVQAALDAVRPMADAKGVQIEHELPRGNVSLISDPARLQQIISNLLTNAVKFSTPNSRVELRASTRNGNLQIEVRDHGAGIATDFLPHVFERFRQADTSTTRAHGGLGLGLSIVRHLVQLHEGTVRAESDGEGRGATFTIFIPLKGPSTVRPTPAPANDAAFELRSGATPPLSDLRLLVVDDDGGACDLLATVLRSAGAHVVTASGGAEATGALQAGSIDVMLVDIGMPIQDGYAFITSVRRGDIAGAQNTPAIAVTAYARQQDVDRALAAGFNTHLAKPFEPAQAINAVRALARRVPDEALRESTA